MTAVLDAPATATGPTVRSTLRRYRGPALVLAGLLLVGVVGGLLSSAGQGGRLDPDSYTPGGARALAQLLRDEGVQVERVGTVTELRGGDRTDRVVLVPFPGVRQRLQLGRAGGHDWSA